MRPAVCLLALFLGLVAGHPALAQENATGREIYVGACAGCHGEEATGTGPMSELLTIPVPDLTRISEREGGSFPWLKVVHLVDGRSGLRGHGGPMPIFGAVFAGDPVAADGPEGTPVITSRRVLEVVDYLMSIQR
ncbi:c-type cytochrome [Albidovulum sediminicola]|uniref:Cytochrome c n=1 Tax=Albidovulum sediminicola TaxID=2984331 RepID=A0ABT2Z5S6_9RHOB|nr:cytochrome c [Defluviimonas sp. WL0075]MCV2866466.1 cytochrome c [Defluviimonas sp. WL0075]